ncbi:alpha/beta hydrolase [Leifsonia poae]|uniref:alpha/beta hydrolase n=1 Tax=Leifsonia poae TaxID=110933 RepID=UPI001CBCFB25|nr:alpha/beta hydrolase-fold protein [Leifsonia poae]
MFDALLRTEIVGGPVFVSVVGLAVAGAAFLLLRRPTRVWIATVAVAIGVGLASAVAAWFVTVRMLNLFGRSLGLGNYLLAAATLCAICLAIVSLRRSRWWRKAIAVLCIPVFVVAGAVAINANDGRSRTIGDLLALPTTQPIRLAAGTTGFPAPGADLWRTWKPPADMLQTGEVHMQEIPHPVSGFPSRPAGIYLPPAALVANPPPLPLVVMMLGQPGSPTPAFAARVLDPFARTHRGLAPIVIVADQLGDPYHDPLCLDTPEYGNAETFLTNDLPAWAQKHLHIIRDHRYWTVAGYSNGGECGLSLIVRHPGLFGNLIDVSGEEYGGSDNPAIALQNVFHGDQAAYDRTKPATYLARNQYPGVNAVFTAGSDDPVYWAAAQTIAHDANDAGMSVELHAVANGKHDQAAFVSGMDAGFDVLFPVLGLAPPATP